MADCEVSKGGRPNIRIEIHNNVMDAEAMDVDEATKLSEGEEGEIIEESVDFDDIIDDKITYPTRPMHDKAKKNYVGSTKGFSQGGFDEEEQRKQADRAKRFQLEQQTASTIARFTNDNLESLHESMGITAENEKQVCFDTLHLHGTDRMNSHDVMQYFHKYKPVSVEWVNKNACNVIFQDDVSSAEALFFMSRSIKGMPVDSTQDNDRGRSVLLRNNNSNGESMSEDDITIADVDIPIPEGYWRLGKAESKSKCLLLRFAMFSDRKALMSESKKALFRGIFDRNKEIGSKNPWGDLAKSWNRDRKTEEVAEPIVTPVPQLNHRLGFKRSQTEAFEEQEEEKPIEKAKIPRMRMYADEEEAKIKRKKALEAIKRAANPSVKLEKPSTDLRSVIRGNSSKNSGVDGASGEDDDDGDEDGEVEGYETRTREDEMVRPEADLGSRLKNRYIKFKNPVPLTIHRRNDNVDVRQRLDDSKLTKQHRFRNELLKSKRLKSPPPPQRQARYSKPVDYEEESDEEVYSDDDLDVKTNSKVTVVIKKPKQPTVASTVWSRVNTTNVKERLHTTANPRSRRRESSESSDDDSNSSDEDRSHSSNENDDKMSDGEIGRTARPGFRDSMADHKEEGRKKPLRIEISNDLYKK